MSNEAYVLFESPSDRKALLGDVVGVAFEGFLAERPDRRRRSMRCQTPSPAAI